MGRDVRTSVGDARTRRALSATACLRLTLGFAGVLVASAGHAADTQVYRTTDAEGHVIYTDRAATPAAQKTTVRVAEPTADDLARLAKDQAASKAAETQRLQQALASSANKAQQQKDSQARCESARARFFTLKDARRLYQRDAEGNRAYLPDAEADAKRAEAQRDMDAACAT